MAVTMQDIEAVFPRPLLAEEKGRAESLIEQALELVELEFARRGRSLEESIERSPWVALAVKQAVRVMVSQAVLVGDNVGQASASSTTGPQSDSITWSQGVPIHWGGVGMDAGVLRILGLGDGVVPLGRGGTIIPYGETAPRGQVRAEFSERRWSR